MATIGMSKLVFFSGQRSVRNWEIVIPILGVIVLGYTLVRNIYPFPSGSAWWGPLTALAWLVVGLFYAVIRSGAASRAGQLLTQAEGLSGQPAAVAVPATAAPAA